jgi:hypothetical protein
MGYWRWLRMPVFLTLKQLADRWEVTPKVVYGMRYRGEGPPGLAVGRELRFRIDDVEEWEKAHVQRPGGR